MSKESQDFLSIKITKFLKAYVLGISVEVSAIRVIKSGGL
jgi:hypothetical protein